MQRNSRAMVFRGVGQPLEPRDFPLPTLQADEVLVEVTCCTLCGSDLHTFAGARTTPLPTVLGHEILGRVAALPGAGTVRDHAGTELRMGDRVTWSVAASCDTCFFCRHHLPQKCQRLFKYGHERIDDVHPLSGGLAEHCHLAAGTAIVRIPDELPDPAACPANCATATVAAAFRYAGPTKDQVVLVQGAGMLGLTACAMARTRGAREVIACDMNPLRLEQATRFGATQAIAVGQGSEELKRIVTDVTEGRGVDLALELCGAPEAWEQGVELLRIGGKHVLVGAVFPTRPARVEAETVVRKLLTIQGVHNYTPDDLATAVLFLTEVHDRYPFTELVGAKFPLADAQNAFDRAKESRAFRVAVVPSTV